MFEIIVVIAIVAIVAALAVRSFYRTMTGTNNGCPGTCSGCAYGKECGGLYSYAPEGRSDHACRPPDTAKPAPEGRDEKAGHPR